MELSLLRIRTAIRATLMPACIALLCAWLVVLVLPLAAQEPAPDQPKEVPATGTPATEPTSAEPSPTAPTADPTDGSAAKPAEPERVLPPPFILDPYRIQVRVSWPVAPAFTGNRAALLGNEVHRDLSARFRQMWVLDCATASSEERQTSHSLHHAVADEWTARHVDAGLDKVIHAVVEQQGQLLTVSALEWCASSQSVSPLVQLETSDPRNLPGLVADAVSRAFRPLGQIEVSEGTKLEFQIRAGEFPPQDPSLAPFQVGQYLVPFMRYLGKKREVLKVQQVPWTYLKVEERDRSRVKVEVKSAFKQPIAGARRRVEVMVMLLRPSWQESEILVYPRNGKPTPLVGYHCDVVDRLPTTEDPVPERDVYYTSRNGTITVPVPEGDPLRYLIVHSGQSVLARLPFLPGTAPRLDVEVPNDRARLSVEGEVSLLQGELIDIVATREVTMARARAAAKKQDWTSVDKFGQQIDKLPTLAEFQTRIETLQLKAVYQAQQAKDRAAESRIKQLCGKVIESAQTHLDPGKIAEFRGQIRATRDQ